MTANLVENALRYAAYEVRVTTVGRDGWAELWVADDGPGISPEDRSRVFHRLYIGGGPARPAYRVGAGAHHRGRTGRGDGRVCPGRVADWGRGRDPDGRGPALRRAGSHKRERGEPCAQHAVPNPRRRLVPAQWRRRTGSPRLIFRLPSSSSEASEGSSPSNWPLVFGPLVGGSPKLNG